MKLLRLVPDNTAIDFLGKRTFTFAVAVLLVAFSVAGLFSRGLNLGIDFLGGTLIEVQTKEPANITDLRSRLGQLNIGEVSIQEFGAADTVLIRVQRAESESQQAIIDAVKNELDNDVAEYRRTEFVGPTVGADLQEAALWSIIGALLAIMVYVWLRFEWQYGVSALCALAHDVFTTLGLFAWLQLDFGLPTVAAILTIAGYSINDTVVVFDNVRENMRKFKTMLITDLLNIAVNQTLSRTAMTSVTTLLALLALFIFGGEVIQSFVIALIWGVIVGTFSSVCLAVPLLVLLKPRRGFDDEEEGPQQQTDNKALDTQPNNPTGSDY